MIGQNYITKKVIGKSILKEIENIYHGLERLTSRFDVFLPTVRASQMQEYTEMMNAHKRYKTALQNKMNSLKEKVLKEKLK